MLEAMQHTQRITWKANEAFYVKLPIGSTRPIGKGYVGTINFDMNERTSNSYSTITSARRWVETRWQRFMRPNEKPSLQKRCADYFRPSGQMATIEHGDIFIEEALQTLRSFEYPMERVAIFRARISNEPPGEQRRKIGATILTLAMLAKHHGYDMIEAAEDELKSR